MWITRRGPFTARRRLATVGLALAIVAVVIVVVLSPLLGGVSHALGFPDGELQRTVVATGLLNPRGITFGPDGALYVAEAGLAGRDRVLAEPERRRYHVGRTGRISRIGMDGSQTIVADGLASALTSHDDDVGPTGIAFIGNTLYVLTAAGGNSWGDPSYDNAIFQIGPDGSASSVFDYQGYNIREPSLSRRSDPRADVAGGMPFGMTSMGGKLYTTDGNLEFVAEVTLDGQARRLLEYPTSNFVMTGITTGPDGALYLAELGPYPYFEGTGKITRLDPASGAQTAWSGLTTPIGVTVAPDGTMYAAEFTAPLKQWENTGRVLRRTPSGQVSVLATGLNFPSAIALGPDGNLYVANNGHHSPDGQGEIVRVEIADTSWLAPFRRLLSGAWR